jgi:hypothetical protein
MSMSIPPTLPAIHHAAPEASSAIVEREQLLDRLQYLRGVLSAFAQEAASARRHAARLRIENRRLLEEIRRLQREQVGR